MHMIRTRRHTDHDQRPANTEHSDIRIDVVVRGNRVQNNVECPGERLEIRRIFGHNEVMGTQVLGILLLGWRGAKYGYIGTHSNGELYAHVPEAAEAHDADLLTWSRSKAA